MAADIDVRTISAFTSLPESTLNNLLDSPTQDLVRSLLEGITSKAKEYEQLKSQKVRLEVEYETHVRTSESKAKVLQNSRDKALADVSKLRVDVQNAENARSRVESDLEQLRQFNATDISEVTNLKTRISSLEASNRDTLALVDSKTSAYDRLSQELHAQHQKIVEIRKRASASEQSLQEANTAAASARFREQSLQQELDLQKKNNDWLESERKIKAEEHTNFRKEKNARISELTRLNEQFIEETEALRRSESALKIRLDEQIKKNEDLLLELQQIREKQIVDADGYRVELDSVNRLAQLQEASANTAKQRVQELSIALEEVRDEAADEIGRIRAEVEFEHQERENAEQQISELETRIADLENDIKNAQAPPATPRRDVNGIGLSTPIRPGTPSGVFSPAFSGRLKNSNSNLTVTQLFGEYKLLEKELAHERRLNAELQTNLDSMLEDLEAKRPEIEELREDQTRLQSEVFEMSTLVEKANHERDDTTKEARILQGRFEALSRELNDYKQTLRDRNSQLRWLIMDRDAQERGDSLSEERFSEMERAAKEADERDTEHLSPSQKVVNQELVLFKSVDELQQQNEKQLITIRNLVERLESAEAKQTQQENADLKTELESARTKIADYQAEIKHMLAQSKSFAKERDMFKNMLTRRARLPGHIDPTDFSRSMPLPAGGSPNQPVADGSVTGGDADYAKLLKDIQNHFDNYRLETTADTTALRAQNGEISGRNAQLQLEASRALGQLSAANQRYDMLQGNYSMLKNENSELQKRSYTAMEAATKQELKSQQAAEELVEARGSLDSLRRESANLRAEKGLWKSIEKRLVEDNESLRNERSRLDQLNGSLQNILNEREQADSETRRRLQSQLESLESELQSAKRKLDEELEESKKAALRREYEHEQSQKRIDDLVASLSISREELASAKTSRDHLQARVDELTIEFRSAEERLEILTRPNSDPSDQAHGISEDTISREQELTVEVSELRRDLELKTTELDRANEQIEVYKGIAQSAEERLNELTETSEQLRSEMEATSSDKESKIKELEQRVEDISAELNTTNMEFTTLRDEQSESARKLDEQKMTFEAEIIRLKDAEEKAIEQAQFNLEASKAQAQIATEAQQNYENELVKHAEAAKTLHSIRAEANQYRLEMVDLKTRVNSAQDDLEQKEASWSDMKDRLERELADLRKRRDEVAQQNTLLHSQLESLTQQITALQRDRAALTNIESTDADSNGTKGLNDLQEVIKYLRREKEIVDVQYHLSTQEAKRLRQQLEFTQTQLDSTRLKLDQQQRAQSDTDRNAMSHSKLMETLNELNLFRESSVTLRAEAKQSTQALSAKSKKLEDLEQQIQPLHARIAELENYSELRDGEMKLLQDDRDHWQQRCQNILSKYDRVDPAELEALKAKLTELEVARDEANASQTALQSQVDAHPSQIEAAKADLRSRLSDQFKARNSLLTGRISEAKAELQTVTTEKEALQMELDEVKQQLEVAKTRVSGTVDSAGEAGITGTSEENSDSSIRITELETKIGELEATLATKDQEVVSAASEANEKFKAKEAQLKEMLNKRLSEFKQEANQAKEAAVEELRKQLNAEHQQELETLRSQSVPVTTELQKPVQASDAADTEVDPPAATAAASPTFEQLMEAMTETQAKQLVGQNKTIRAILTDNIRKKVKAAEDAIRQELASGSVSAPEGASNASNEEVEKKYQAEKEAIIEQKEQEFVAEKETLAREFEQRLETERQNLIAQREQELASERLVFSKESERKIAEQVANAQMLAEKKAALKLNMAQNKAAQSAVKLEVVRKAAEETPDKAVKEVWDIAKDAKPVPQQQAKPAAVPQTSTTGKLPVPATAAPAPGVSTSTPVEPVTNGTETNGTVGNITTEPVTGSSETDVAGDQPKAAQVSTNSGPSTSTQPRNTSIPQARGALRGGRGGAAGGHQAQQGAPQQAQATRGTGIPRGRGAARGGNTRGAPQSGIPAAQSNRGGAGSPSRGGLNAAAQQFVPGGGNKRAREDNEGGNDGNAGKRIRGGGNVGA